MLNTIGEFMRKKRVQEGLSQLQVAQRIGVSLATISKWEHHRTQVAGEFLTKAITFLGFNPKSGSSKTNTAP